MLRVREPINSLTHFIGAVLSGLALLLMIVRSVYIQDWLYLSASIIFGLSLIALYTASTVYHALPCTDKVKLILKKVDHSMIYVLIAGTYTPICLIALDDYTGTFLLTLIWSVAIVGIIIKLAWINAPRWLSTLFYVALGWVAIFFIAPISKALPTSAVVWLLVGGISYTIGAIIYATKPNFLGFRSLGFHEIFHCFVLLGSYAHVVMVYNFILV